jgi:hypothetical protein
MQLVDKINMLYLSFLMFLQETIVYADVGPRSNNRSQSPGNTLEFDEHRVEYAQLNHKAVPVISTPVSSTEKPTNKGITLI